MSSSSKIPGDAIIVSKVSSDSNNSDHSDGVLSIDEAITTTNTTSTGSTTIATTSVVRSTTDSKNDSSNKKSNSSDNGNTNSSSSSSSRHYPYHANLDQAIRDPAERPVFKLSVRLIDTYKYINKVR